MIRPHAEQLLLVAALAVWSCGPGGVGTPTIEPVPSAGAPTATLPGAPTADVATPSTPASLPAATALASPPTAWLAGPARGEVEGDLGSFSWDGLASDSPWIVERKGVTLAQGTRPSVRFDADLGQVEWTARWARVDGAETGRPRSAGQGGAGPVIIDAPPGAGSWSLQLEAAFAEGRRATWYWRVDVGR